MQDAVGWSSSGAYVAMRVAFCSQFSLWRPARKDPCCRLDSQTLAHATVELAEIIGGGVSGEPKKLLEGMASGPGFGRGSDLP